ncbi:unnamed protein product [Schistocephalus solidus]|uniref:Fibulin-1 n=1 Tax=Schistocephalus solidus TaxID=70667 RepID=A0A183SZZ6_SCHSO|nr:unnamed protein product [Schistocephalus solidus]
MDAEQGTYIVMVFQATDHRMQKTLTMCLNAKLTETVQRPMVTTAAQLQDNFVIKVVSSHSGPVSDRLSIEDSHFTIYREIFTRIRLNEYNELL